MEKKILGFRNMQEKLEKKDSVQNGSDLPRRVSISLKIRPQHYWPHEDLVGTMESKFLWSRNWICKFSLILNIIIFWLKTSLKIHHTVIKKKSSWNSHSMYLDHFFIAPRPGTARLVKLFSLGFWKKWEQGNLLSRFSDL